MVLLTRAEYNNTSYIVRVPNAGFGENRSMESVLSDIARVVNYAQKSALRYGKRSSAYVSQMNLLGRGTRDSGNKGIVSTIDEIAKAALYPKKWAIPVDYDKEKRHLSTIMPGFHPSPALIRIMGVLIDIERKRYEESLINPFKMVQDQKPKSEVEQLAQILFKIEQTRKNPTLNNVQGYYQKKFKMPARPGKRSMPVPMRRVSFPFSAGTKSLGTSHEALLFSLSRLTSSEAKKVRRPIE
ncbi:unnamed protein product [Caenorhabditis sp. 36 PRJEB53466]|nr:unnamed protein product [Caenorhabditis sp. 36 PRJEB53466]